MKDMKEMKERNERCKFSSMSEMKEEKEVSHSNLKCCTYYVRTFVRLCLYGCMFSVHTDDASRTT